MKKISLFLLVVLFISSVLAVYPGETIIQEHDLETENLMYTIIDNSTKIPELNVTINSTHITIFFPYDTPEDNFKIVFMEQQTKEIIKEVKVSSGGGTRTRYIEKNNTVYVNDTRYIPIEKECENCNSTNKTEVPNETEEIEDSSNWWIAAIIFGVILIALIIWLISNRDTKEDYSDI